MSSQKSEAYFLKQIFPNYPSLILYVLSLLIVGFGQPARSGLCAPLAASCGFALFWAILLPITSQTKRFWISTAWFTAVQLIQLSWLPSHPFLYIYGVYFLLALGMGLQFGLLTLALRKSLQQGGVCLLGMAGFWVWMEWTRLFVMSGLPFNPVGLSLTAFLYPLQTASLAGVYGLSFVVILTNLLALKAWTQRFSLTPAMLWITLAVSPYLFGVIHVRMHETSFTQHEKQPSNQSYYAMLVQTAFPIEELLPPEERKELMSLVLDEWQQILTITKKHHGKKVDLLVLPELVVPYGTFSYAYPHEKVLKIFREIYGEEILALLPKLQEYLGYYLETDQGNLWLVNNAYWAQALANIFQAEVVVGLQDAEEIGGQLEYYSAAMHFKPDYPSNSEYQVGRYSKRVLVPMGEYIPFSIFRKLAASYGVEGSFTAGKEANILGYKKPLGLSICYEEMYGHLIRESRLSGAQLLVNITSDVWFPFSLLNQQHFDHARLRTVENGLPLIRACNTGITAAVDSLGRLVSVLGDTPAESEWLSDALFVRVPTYTYQTLYGRLGDGLILGLSATFILLALTKRYLNRNSCR